MMMMIMMMTMRRRRIWEEGKGVLETGVTSEEIEADEDTHPEDREGSFSRRDVILIDTSRTGQSLEDHQHCVRCGWQDRRVVAKRLRLESSGALCCCMAAG